MKDQGQTNQPASGSADNKDLTAKGSANPAAYPNKMNERKDIGSPYAGTQSSDPLSPDGLQTPVANADSPEPEDSPETGGQEYGTNDSYGHKDGNADNEKSEPGEEEEGSPVR